MIILLTDKTLTMSQEVLQFNKVMFDDSLHDYINGNLIIKMKINKCDNKVNNINNVIKSVTIDFYLDKYNIEKTNENILKYSKIYDSLLNTNNKEIIDKIKPCCYNEKDYSDDDEYNEDHRLHYQQYFGRYKDLLYIIDYYEKLIEEYENKEYESIEENNDYISDNESYISDYDYEDDINNYEEDYDEEEYYDDEY